MFRKLGALILALGLSLSPASAFADVAGPTGTGGGGAGGMGGAGGSGGSAGEGGQQSGGGGCVTATPGSTTRTAAMVLGLGLLLAIPAARSRRSKKPR
jgi:hypothetical protein